MFSYLGQNKILNKTNECAAIMLKEETIKSFLLKHFKEDKTRVSSDVVLMMKLLIEIFVEEALQRANRQAELESSGNIDIEHLEKILPQLLLDF